MSKDSDGLVGRIEQLERTIWRTRLVAATSAIGLLAPWLVGAAAPDSQNPGPSVQGSS